MEIEISILTKQNDLFYYYNDLITWGFSVRVEISHDNQRRYKNKITIICKNFITVNGAEISTRFEKTERKFSSHVNELKTII